MFSGHQVYVFSFIFSLLFLAYVIAIRIGKAPRVARRHKLLTGFGGLLISPIFLPFMLAPADRQGIWPALSIATGVVVAISSIVFLFTPASENNHKEDMIFWMHLLGKKGRIARKLGFSGGIALIVLGLVMMVTQYPASRKGMDVLIAGVFIFAISGMSTAAYLRWKLNSEIKR